jgi:nondiscriminating glutamyl-tRNA synthetase
MTQVRTRFAPSPTGSLHLGNLRVAVFNHLFARHHQGAFVVRVEDTDVERNVPGALDGILDDLRWAGLHWDEGPDVGGPYEPYRQSERGDTYRKVADRLHEEGKGYPCFCTDEEMEAARAADRVGAGCPGDCKQLEPARAEARQNRGEPWALRFSIPDDIIEFQDEVRGSIRFDSKDVGDFIILRADGRATYNFAVVVDDIAMKITHVIRGAGHLSNTPKQAVLFDALAEDRPTFVHLPMVLGADRRKLSKREGAEGLERLRSEGFHPDGVVNYLSLLGWSPGEDREVLGRDELVQSMDLSRIGASDTVFDPEKLRWMSQQHIARMGDEELVRAVRPFLDRDRFPLSDVELPPAVRAIRTRLTTFSEVNEHLALLFPDEGRLERGREELMEEPDAVEVLTAVRRRLAELDGWDDDQTAEAVRAGGKEAGARGRALFHPVRIAVSGARKGPDLGDLLAGLGRDRTLALLDEALLRIREEREHPD